MKHALVVLALLTLAACGGGGGEGSGNATAVKKAVKEQAESFSSGDYGGAWDQWVDSAKKVMSRDDYIALGKKCDLGGIPLESKFVRFENKDKTEAVVRVGLGDVMSSYTMKLEDGDWSWVPSDDALADYAKGLDGAIAAFKEEGICD